MSAWLTPLTHFEVPPEYLPMTLRLLAAVAAGGLIGLERSYHGRPAGFRTHTLVCLSTCLLMLVTVYETYWFPAIFQGRVTIDPTRLAQGIMTGIGFLGAGAILKEGLSVRGLTTAASIWITAALGILIGIGFYFPAVVATVLTLGTLSVFRWIEIRMPMQTYVLLRRALRRQMPSYRRTRCGACWPATASRSAASPIAWTRPKTSSSTAWSSAPTASAT